MIKIVNTATGETRWIPDDGFIPIGWNIVINVYVEEEYTIPGEDAPYPALEYKKTNYLLLIILVVFLILANKYGG